MLYASADRCRELAALHPQARLGWDGERKTFGLIQLYKRRDWLRSFRERWDNGPVFSRTGRTTPDWDFWTRVPVYLIDISPRDVQTGAVIGLVKRWVRPIAARVYEDAMERSGNTERRAEAMGSDMGERLYREGQRDGAGAPICAKKHAEPTVNMERYRRGELDFSKSQLPPAPPGGWDKHLEKDQGDA